jgi:hypothetical protein
MKKLQALTENYAKKLEKALGHLSYSYQKILQLPTEIDQLDDETLETWESFSSRFSRAVDLFLTKFLRSVVLQNDPGFEGSLRDLVNFAERLKLIDNAELWMGLRELRNISAHEYADESISNYFERVKEYCPKVLALLDVIEPFTKEPCALAKKSEKK